MQNSSGQRSPPYPYYAPASPPWSPFPIVPPASFATAELTGRSSVPQSVSGVFHLRSIMTDQDSLPLNNDGEKDSASHPLGMQLGPVPLCESRGWHMQQAHQCIDMDDTIGLGREILEADMVFEESIEETQATSDVQESPERDDTVAENSRRECSNVLLLKFGSEPYIGMQFRSEGEAYEYYKAYAKENGFSIRKSHVERSRVDHSLISRKLVCVKQGFRSLKDKRYEGKVVRHRRVTRVDCRAAMIIKRRSGKWVIHRFHKEHNHDLGDHAKAFEPQPDRKITNSTNSVFDALYKSQGIDIQDNFSHCEKISEGSRYVFDESQEPQPTIVVQEFANEGLNMAEISEREGNAVQESPNGDVNTAETSGREDDDASLIKLGSEPYIGLQFGSQDEAYEFYNAYAKEKGFSIRKSRIERSRIDHSMISRLFVCAHQGLRSTKDKRYEGKVVRSRQETRLDCRAAMFIKRKAQKWVIERFHKEHNHEPVDPAKAEKLRSHRKMTMATKSMIEALYRCGVGPSKIVDLITEVADGAKDILGNNEEKDILGDNEGASESNNMKKERKNNIRAECYQLLEYFQGIQAVDPGFFYALEFGENRCLRSIFWADGKAREACKRFGDVLVFDTVCRTNKYLFPFVSFTGVNHHKQSVLFGCGFLADETAESFVWIFETWLRAMSDRQPTSIITSQDRTMKVAIEKVFPETRHRFCMAQIEKDELENLTHVFDMHTDFHAEYKKCIHRSRTPKEFESVWEALLVKYNLKDNKWLHKLYNQRRHWVPLYLRDTFFGGMTTTHRNEGMHSYFHGFLHGGTPFSEFISQYEQAIKQRREEETDEDFLTVFTRAVLISKNPIEAHAGRVYTRTMFKVFEHEFVESSGCSARKIGEEGNIHKYFVGKYREKEDKMQIVAFDPMDSSANCSCQMFDSEGMLCRHILKVFQLVDVFEIPPRYILRRWTMGDRHMESCCDETGGCSHDPTRTNVWTLKDKTEKFVELGETSKEGINLALNILQEGIKKLAVISVPAVPMQPEIMGYNSIQGENIDEQSDSTWMMDLNITVPDLPRIKQRGRPLSSRMRIGFEQNPKKKRTCGTCKEAGHYTRTCPKGAVDQSQTSISLQGPVGHSRSSAILQGTGDQSQNSSLLQVPIDQSETSTMIQESLDQPQTSMMLQGTFGQTHIFAML